MKYRKFGKLDWEVSALGFGSMRLPLLDKSQAKVDESLAIRMIRYAIDHGVNYVDSAHFYHEGRSEVVVGKALQDGYRQRVKLATKLPSWHVKSLGDCDRYLNEQLERLQTNKIEFYLMHGLNRNLWTHLKDLKVLDWAERAKAAGRIDYIGFSFHDDFEVFKKVVDGYDNWTVCLIQYNYMDVDCQAGVRGLKYAADKGIAVAIMEPQRGGRLSKKPTESVEKLWATARQKRTPAEWAMQWVWNQPEVSVVLSGMSAMEHVVENVAVAERSAIGILTNDELALIDQVREAYRKLSPIPCTSCGYCMPCPNGVEIPHIFEIYNEGIMYDDLKAARFFYRSPEWLKAGSHADQCVECNKCAEVCPQHLPISEWLKKVHSMLGKKDKSQ